MFWWKDLIAPVIVGVLVVTFGLFIGAKRTKRHFYIYKKALIKELEGNFKGRGGSVPFQTFWLETILKNYYFRKNYPRIFEQACQCLVIAGRKQGDKPSEVQQEMNLLKEGLIKIQKNNFFKEMKSFFL